MLKKIYRLPSVSNKGSKKISTILFDVKVSKNDLGFPRFGFVISKKIDKRAVLRNSIKRKLSVCVENIFDRIEGGNDFVFYPKKKIITCTPKEISEEVDKAFTREGFLND